MLPPGPKIRSSLLLAIRRTLDPLTFFTQLAQDYGDVVHVKVGTPDIFLINNPVYIKRVLVTDHHNFTKGQGLQKAKILLGDGLLTSEGELHRKHRRLMQPAFHHTRIARYAEIMVDYADRITGRWQHGATIDISAEMMRLTMAIVAKTLFNADVESEAADVGRG